MDTDVERAADLARTHYPEAIGVLLAGSVARNEATPTSDFDLIILREAVLKPIRECHRIGERRAEAFIHSPDTLSRSMEQDVLLRKPSHIRMCFEALVLLDRDGHCTELKRKAKFLFEQGPPALTEDERALLRFEISVLAEDLVGVDDEFEVAMEASALAERVADYYLGLKHAWTGFHRWRVRELRRHDPFAAESLFNALQTCYRVGDSEPLLRFTRDVLKMGDSS